MPQAGAGTDAGGAKGHGTHGHQGAVFLRTELEFLDAVRAVADAQKFQFAIEHQLDRRFGCLGQTGGNGAVTAGLQLAAKGRAHVLANHPHFVRRHVQKFGNALANPVHRLGGIVKDQLVAFPHRDAAVGFQRRMHLHLGAVFTLDHHLCFGKSGIRIAFAADIRVAQVAAVFKNTRRAVLHGRVDVRRKGPGFVFHLDQFQRIPGDLRGNRRHRRHILAGEADGAGGMHIGEHDLHARQFARLARIDANDFSSGMR